MDENNNRILESQLQKDPERPFPRNKHSILYLPLYKSCLGCRKGGTNGPKFCIWEGVTGMDWDFRAIALTEMPRMNYKEQGWQRVKDGGGCKNEGRNFEA